MSSVWSESGWKPSFFPFRDWSFMKMSLFMAKTHTCRMSFGLLSVLKRLGRFFLTCPGVDGGWGLAPPPRIDRHDAQFVVGVGLELHHSSRGAAHHCLGEEIFRLRPQDVAGCPGNLCELHCDAVAVFGVGLFNAGYLRRWRTQDSHNKNKIKYLNTEVE